MPETYLEMARRVIADRKTVIVPLGSYILARLIPAAVESEGGIAVPDALQQATGDAVALAVGPGREVAGGRVRMQARAGDRLLFARHHFREMADGEGFLSDGDVAARIAPDTWDLPVTPMDLQPANDYVLVRMLEAAAPTSPVIRATASLIGGQSRMELQGEYLYCEMHRLRETERWRQAGPADVDANTPQREAIVHDFLDGLSSEEVAAIGQADKRRRAGLPTKERRPITPQVVPVRARVLAVGPGRACAETGERRRPEGIAVGQTVILDRERTGLSLLGVMLVQARFVGAVVEP